MTWDKCCEKCLNDGTCTYQETDKIEDCDYYLSYGSYNCNNVFYNIYPIEKEEDFCEI